MTFGVHLVSALNAKRMTQRSLAEKVGVSPVYLNKLCKGNKTPSLELIEKICDALDMTLGELFSSTSDSIGVTMSFEDYQIYSDMRLILPCERKAIAKMIASLKESHGNKNLHILQDVADRPVAGYAAAGAPLFDDTNNDDAVAVPEKYLDRDRYFIVQARGQSMVPRINNGDYVVVEKEAEPASGEIALVRVDGIASDEYTIKRFYVRGDQVELRAFNAEFAPMFYPLEELKSAEKVVHVIPGIAKG